MTLKKVSVSSFMKEGVKAKKPCPERRTQPEQAVKGR